MTPRVYYNDNDAFACDWLAELMRDGLIAEGDIDRRSITDIDAADLAGYTRCHFFAGIGGWELALQLAGWPDDREVWTGSCPCQPFSSAGNRKGTSDERHMWPVFRDLIRARRPGIVFGEQVASSEVVGTKQEADFAVAVQSGNYAKANRIANRLTKATSFHYHPRWLDGVRTDLDASGYSFDAVVLGAHSVGAPHIRQRLWWVADSYGKHYGGECTSGVCPKSSTQGKARQRQRGGGDAGLRSPDGHGLANADRGRLQEHGECNGEAEGVGEAQQRNNALRCNTAGCSGGLDYGLGDAGCSRSSQLGGGREQSARSPAPERHDRVGLVRCEEPGRVVYRPAPLEPALFPLADGIPNRVGTLRGAGNAIVPQVAAEFVAAFMEAEVAA